MNTIQPNIIPPGYHARTRTNIRLDSYQTRPSEELRLIPRPQPAQLTGHVLRKGDPGWKEACTNFAGRVDAASVEPKAVVFVGSEQDVSNAVRWAREQKMPFRIRCGRHSYEAYSLVKDGLVIDVTHLNRVSVDSKTGLAKVGAGSRCLDVADALAEHGRVLPLPTFPSVGIAGATLGGGVGMTSRKYGLTCDNLVSARVVLADGKVVEASEKENPDLFWALKGGGGGNFGVVTEFTFQTHPVQNVAVFNAAWDWSKFDQIVDAYGKWAPTVDENLTGALRVTADRKIALYGQYTPDDDTGLPGVKTALHSLFAQVPPDHQEVRFLSPAVAARVFGQVDPVEKDWRKSLRKEQIFKSTSAIADRPLPKDGIAKLREAMENSPKTNGEFNPDQDMVQFLPGGGATARVAADRTAARRRQCAYILQYDAYWQKPEDEAANTDWVLKLRDDLMPYATGAYVNYHDSRLEDPLVAYYGANLIRLSEVKAKYDPENVFQYPQSVPVRLTEAQRQAALVSG